MTASFKFRFASLLELRRRQRDEAGAAMGKANEAIGRVDQQMELLQAERETLRTTQSGNRVGNLSVDALLHGGRYDLQLQADLHALGKTRGELLQERQRRQNKLTEAEAEVKRFERLQENDHRAHQAEMRRREQAEADDQVARRYTIARQRADS